jgi:hypothetical protein
MRVLVTQLIERKPATFRNTQGLRQQLWRIEVCQALAGAQVALTIGV